MTPDRRLQRGPVEDLAFDCGGLEGLRAQPLDAQLGLVPCIEMPPGADAPPGRVQEARLQGPQPRPVHGKRRPIGMLPVQVMGDSEAFYRPLSARPGAIATPVQSAFASPSIAIMSRSQYRQIVDRAGRSALFVHRHAHLHGDGEFEPLAAAEPQAASRRQGSWRSREVLPRHAPPAGLKAECPPRCWPQPAPPTP